MPVRTCWAAMVRRWPAGLADARVIPVAALAVRLGDGRTVAQQVADAFFGGDLTALRGRRYLRLLVEVHVRLWLVHGVALEAHQQNTALVVDEVAGTPQAAAAAQGQRRAATGPRRARRQPRSGG